MIQREPAPARVTNIETYWNDPPPEQSKRCTWWMARVRFGWRPNRRIRALGYYPSAQHFGVYIWEWINVLAPAIFPRVDHGCFDGNPEPDTFDACRRS